MLKTEVKPKNASLEKLGIKNAKAFWNLSPEKLAEIAIEKGQAKMTNTGAIAVNTGEFTGRSPKDRFIVKDDITKDSVWWGNINIPFDPEKFDKLYDKIVGYLSGKDVYVRDAYACADPEHKTNIRVVNEYPWSNQFVYNMFLRPTEEELKNMEPDWLVINAPGFTSDPTVDGTRQHNFSILNFTKKIAIVGGSAYTGEIKKGIFSALNFELPHFRNTLSMHCSANIGEKGDTAIFFGLSGTGKTTLSADPNRKLIGDDEHGWSHDNKIFNFEGGCYAKVIDLSEEKEPDIFRAIRPGAILENIVFKEGTDEVDYTDGSITENTRVSYPIYNIDNIATPSIGENPKNIFFLTADASGVLPPISRLNPGQAAFHFISGYTSKVAGTEMGITEPQPTFSAGFGAAFLPLHPTKYAELLSKNMKEQNVNVWLINTGWAEGPYGKADRMKLKYTRAMITAALNGELDNVEYHTHTIFGIDMPMSCPGVPSEILSPKHCWNDDEAFYKAANKLAESFNKNFEKFAEYANEEILAGAPKTK